MEGIRNTYSFFNPTRYTISLSSDADRRSVFLRLFFFTVDCCKQSNFHSLQPFLKKRGRFSCVWAENCSCKSGPWNLLQRSYETRRISLWCLALCDLDDFFNQSFDLIIINDWNIAGMVSVFPDQNLNFWSYWTTYKQYSLLWYNYHKRHTSFGYFAFGK